VPRFSLIVATMSRTNELKRFLESLTQQDFSDYEVILVDQNDDDRLQGIIDEFAGRVPLLRISSPKGASRARNNGLRAASGDLIAFPDDDCWYSPGLLPKVGQWFQDHPKYSIFAVGAVDEDGVLSGNRWFQSSCDLLPINVFRTTFCSSLFFRWEALYGNAFDEAIGPGSSTGFGCGDETDLVLKVLNSRFRGRFDRTWCIGHPRRDMLYDGVSRSRAFTYGSGMGYVLWKHSLLYLWIGLLTYDVLRGLLVFSRGRPSAASLCFVHASGLVRGFAAGGGARAMLHGEVSVEAPE
jgi:glycosyltransferase involved in cell wall biosynthesis